MITLFEAPSCGILIERDEASGEQRISGKYDCISIRAAIPLNDGRCVILLDRNAVVQSAAFPNVLCIDTAGKTLWIAKLPTAPDSFVALRASGDDISATSFSGYKLILDPNTGKELSRIFVK